MAMIERLGIAGVGLIGGSLALAARRAGVAREIVGLGRTRANLDLALARGILDRADVTPDILAGADLVLLATPIGLLAATAQAIAPHLAPGAIVTDAGSVKANVVRDVTAALGPGLRFVGGHPIAGTEDSGAVAADPDLFRGARCVLTPVAASDRAAVARVRALWEAVGMEVVEMAPAHHDDLLALTSHLPHVLAFALALAAGGSKASPGTEALEFAGPSFRSATRVASSLPETWRDILVANADAVERALASLRVRIQEIVGAARSDPSGLEALLAEGRGVRRSLGQDTRSPSAMATDTGPALAAVAPARGPLSGEVRVPGDKSIAHRALLFGGVAHGTTVVHGVGGGEDNASTISVLRALGVRVERAGSTVRIEGRGFEGLEAPRGVLDCGNSGTTMRLMAGLLAARPFVSRLDGDASLRRRPMRRVMEPLERMGARFVSADGRPPIEVHGGLLAPARFELAIPSAQVKTAIVLAGLQAAGETVVREPALSRDHTERLLGAFGGVVERRSPVEIAVRGPQSLRGASIDVPGDPSAAAFWLVAGSIVPGSRLVVREVCVNPTRTGAIDVLCSMGARLRLVERPPVGEEPVADVEVEASPLRSVSIGGETMLRAIDEFPVLAVAAALASGETRFTDAGELRVKESDRIAAMATGLRALGAEVEESPDGLVVRGPTVLSGGTVESHGDHRVAMAFAIAALVARGPVVIRGAEAIAVSDPGFLATLDRLRGRVG